MANVLGRIGDIAVQALGKQKDPRAVKPLIDALRDEDCGNGGKEIGYNNLLCFRCPS